MVRPRWCSGRKLFAHAPHQQRLRPLYTPTLNGFERVLCEMVDLEGEAGEGGQCIATRESC